MSPQRATVVNVNLFCESTARRDALRELKRAVVRRLGNSGDRKALEFARRLFAEIPELRSA
jgi:hypothetical protein